MQTFDYAKKALPVEYHCTKCGAFGCRLWRRAASSCIEPLCLSCTETQEKKTANLKKDVRVGNYVPAIPSRDNTGYYAYAVAEPSAEHRSAIDWWWGLPLQAGFTVRSR